jgi:hypothetical protein
MTGLEHSLLATGLLAAFYYLGVHFGKKDAVEEAVEFTLDTLEKGNYVKVLYNEKTKEKELIPLDKTT